MRAEKKCIQYFAHNKYKIIIAEYIVAIHLFLFHLIKIFTYIQYRYKYHYTIHIVLGKSQAM